jgi:hypothetical protein
MIIYSDHISERLEYICSFLFREVLGQQYLLTNKTEDIEKVDQSVLVYSNSLNTRYFTIIPHSLLLEDEIINFIPDHRNSGNEIELFPNEYGHFSFDILSATFYMLSRYEEYQDFEPDKYDRFTAQNSLAFKLGFLKWPIVNIWASKLALALLKFYPSFTFSIPNSSYKFSIDIDIAWDVKNKGFVRATSAFLRSIIKLDLKDVIYRIKVLNNNLPDRFDAYDLILKSHQPEELRIFILLANRNKYDPNIHYQNQEFIRLIKKLSSKYELGVHPSFLSFEKKSLVNLEKKRLEDIVEKPLKASRQHFLRLRFPETYRTLINSELMEDYSMVFADQTGFRAGTSFSFDWYDLKSEKHTKLRIHPACLMDRTLKDYYKLSPDDALSHINEILDNIKDFGGVFIPIWHNDSVKGQGEWEGWDEVYKKMLLKARQL